MKIKDKFIGYKIFSRTLLKLKFINESLPKAWELKLRKVINYRSALTVYVDCFSRKHQLNVWLPQFENKHLY